MKFIKKGIQDEWHFVIGKAAGDIEEFYEELENQLAPQIAALGLKSGYRNVGGIFRKKRMHFVKYGGYMSLTCAEPFGTDLNISWYLYYIKASPYGVETGLRLTLSDLLGHITGKTRDKIIAFASVGKDCAEQATRAILSQREEKESEQSGNLVKS